MYLTGREANIRGIMKVGEKMTVAHTTRTSSGRIGTGRQISRTKTTVELISEKILEQIQLANYRITMQYWDLTGQAVFFNVSVVIAK